MTALSSNYRELRGQMKKQNQRKKKKKKKSKKNPQPTGDRASQTKVESLKKKPTNQKAIRNSPKKPAEKRGRTDGRSIAKFTSKAGQFLREARVELRKVKWPTRKELIASTAVVIVLTLVIAFFLGLVDFGLIKIIKNIVG